MNCRNILIIAAVVTWLPGCADLPASRPGPESTEYHFVVEIRATQTESDLATYGEQVWSRSVETEPLFPNVDSNDDPIGLSRLFILTARSEDPDQNPWDMAYALLDAGNFIAVEPNLRDTLEDVSARTGAATGCMGDGVPAPVDPAWALREVRAPQAWALVPHPGGKRFGEGVRICHADTGWTEHVDLDSDRLELGSAWNTLDGNSNAEDPLGYRGHPGHGVGTGSVIMSSGRVDDVGTTVRGLVTGVAPKSTLVPIRTMKNVVRFLDSDVARAVHHATTAQCDVISMSFGGRAFFGLERAIRDAVQRDLIVIAAAGNCVGFVVAPAMYEDTIAVAATNSMSKPWLGTSHGSSVIISAPGEDVYRAQRSEQSDPNDAVKPSDGTSYATAMVAGAAALWLAHKGEGMSDGRTRQARFVEALRASANRPSDWDTTEMGAGIIDLEALLQHETTAFTDLPTRIALNPGEHHVMLLARQTATPPEVVRAALQQLIGTANFDKNMRRLGPELLYIAATQPEAFGNSLNAVATPPDLATRATARQGISEFGSETLSIHLQN